ncbi:hypothetical protein TRVL_06096 [Trypanosoma vivax]|nr:hypothetical protein TRVL_06096 [Trypanosoma vivax]
MDSNDTFLAASSSFVYNTVAIGVCGNKQCSNSFNPALFSLPYNPTYAPVPVPPMSPDVLHATLRADVFPQGVIGRQLCSSYTQLAVTLEDYVARLFSAAQVQFGCSLDTLAHCLWLLERLQHKNILAQQRGIMVLRDALAMGNIPGEGLSVHKASLCGTALFGGARFTRMKNNGAFAEETWERSPLPSASTAAWSTPLAAENKDRFFCGACNQFDSFSLQLWNVQLYLAAALLLSIKINEDKFAEMDEELLAAEFGQTSGCDAVTLRCAERCLCEVLCDELHVTKCGLDSVVRRLALYH